MTHKNKPNHLTEQQNEAIKEFRTYLANVETLRKDTVDTYITTTRQFLHEIVKEGNPFEITKKHIFDWKAFCSKYAESCLSTKFSSLNRYVEYLIKTDKTKDTTLLGWKLKARRNQSSKDARTIQILDRDLVQKIFEVSKENRARDYAIFRVLYDGALRRKELITLNVNDVNLKNRTLLLRETKNHKDRMPNISRDTAEAIEEYLKIREQPQEGHENALFLNDGRRISKTKLFEMFKEYKFRLKLPVDFKFNPHLWRHTSCSHFGEELSKSKKNEPEKLKFLQQQTGHTDITMLMHYLHFNSGEQKKCFDEIFSAREQKIQEQTQKPLPPIPPQQPEPILPQIAKQNPDEEREKIVDMYKQGLLTLDELKDCMERFAVVTLKPKRN